MSWHVAVALSRHTGLRCRARGRGAGSAMPGDVGLALPVPVVAVLGTQGSTELQSPAPGVPAVPHSEPHTPWHRPGWDSCPPGPCLRARHLRPLQPLAPRQDRRGPREPQ